MSTLQIKKLESGVFKHVDSIDGEFFLGRFSFKQELDKAFLVEAYGAKRREYDVLQISVFDYLGTAELFTNWTDLENRLTELGYTGIETNGIIPTASSYISSDADNALQLGADSKLFVPESAGDFLSNDPTTYSPATLPLTDTEVALLHDGTNWVKITWNNIITSLSSVFQVIEKLVTNASVTGSYGIDWSNDVWDLTLTGNTTLTESNLPASGKTKTITLNISGNFTLTYPAGWTSKITGAYSGTATLNTITIQYYGSGKYKVLIVQPT
jgi:hypothetical protein